MTPPAACSFFLCSILGQSSGESGFSYYEAFFMSGSSPVHLAWIQWLHQRTGSRRSRRGRTQSRGNGMKEVKTMGPAALLMLLVIAAMGVMVFWGLSLLDLSE